MRKTLFGSSLLLVAIAVVSILQAGCSSSSTTTLSQEVSNVEWLPDESGMVAFIDQITEDAYGNQTEGQNLYQVNSSGSIGNALNSSAISPDLNYWSAPVIYVSSDGKTAITGFGADIYSIPTGGGNVNDIIQSTALFGISSDGKYAITSPTPANVAAILWPFMFSSSNITAQTHRTIPGIFSNRALWLNNDEYALSIVDSTDALGLHEHVTIYNAQGDSVMAIPNGDVSFSASAFSPGANEIFVRTNAFGIDGINLTTGVRTQIINTDSVESMDASSDGTLVVYTSKEASQTYGTMYAVNASNGHIKPMNVTGIILPRISPKGDRVACINQIDGQNSNINVFTVTTPP